MLSPACAWSRSFRNISTPVTTVFRVSPKPTISISSPTFTTPRSTRPVTTVPRPVIVNTSSTLIRNGLSTSRNGSGINVSSALTSSQIGFAASPVGSAIAFVADPRMIGVLSPGNLYFVSRSRTSSSTRSRISGSSTRSHLFMNTTIAGTFTWWASRMCSRVCGIGPSAADTTSTAPSICAAPEIMFLM